MPYLRVEVATGLDADTKRELLARTAETFAAILESPVDRIRTQVLEVPGDAFAVGGVPIADSGEQAPFIHLDLLEGRPIDQHTALIEQISALVADIVGVPVERTRMRINEVPPADWGIGGVPAAAKRRAEIDARRDDS